MRSYERQVPTLDVSLTIDERDDLMLALQTLKSGSEIRELPEAQQKSVAALWRLLADWNV